MKQFLFIIASLLLFASCTKEIHLDLDNKSGNIVIEGNVTNQPGPYYVRITKSVAFTETNQYPPITNAIVIISDNTGQIDTLRYVADGNYKTTRLVSMPGRTYNLRILAQGLIYTAKSTMPQTVALDSLVQRSFSIGGKVNYNILPIFTDPAPLGNRYLFILSVNARKDKTLQAFSDNINNGVVNQRELMTPSDDDKKVNINDMVHIEMQCIDQDIYSYYTGLIQISGSSGPGGSVTPANPPSNISNGALGYFSAHTSVIRNIVIK
ncbi:DUF4249 domain-containing protein [Mucilaginibacter sp. HMF5004]|uniref:DUF4249 domain-containing protein n=1 Tax=Mucilaginibacter rivuli TaxID=2857527 RepID=UPI001C5D0613|nr:DUF4249 domain-containing protein [Mucilaginibacter rivuli]MBW4888923.1 DUF4249 domain-containing protein [Mucilaginibacter rivuli]